MRRLWTRLGCLAALLLSAAPAGAVPPALHRIVAVGDLHGDFSAWRDIIRAAQLVDDKGRWTGGDAVLVQDGDVVDRGPNSLEIIHDLMRLQREALRAHGQVIALVGNHEAMNMTGDLRYLTAADYAAFTDNRSAQRREAIYAANKALIETAYHQHDPQMTSDAIKQAWIAATPLGSIEHRLAWRPDGEIGKWVTGNPAVVVLDGTLFVHGGISPAYVHLSVTQINAQVRDALKSQNTDPQAIINDPLGPLWYRGLATPDADVAADASAGTAVPAPIAPAAPPIADQLTTVLQAYDIKRIVIAHTPILSGITMLYDGRLIRIDTGISAIYGGAVSYLDILDGTPVPHVVARSPSP